MTDREKLIEICAKLVFGCKEKFCADCEHKGIAYPRCRATYMADRSIEALEVEKNDNCNMQ